MVKNYIKFSSIFILTFLYRLNHAQLFNRQINSYSVVYYDEVDAQNSVQYKFNYKEVIITENKKSKRCIYNYDNEGRIVSYLKENRNKSPKSKGFLIQYTVPVKKLKKKVVHFKSNIAFKTSEFEYIFMIKLSPIHYWIRRWL